MTEEKGHILLVEDSPTQAKEYSLYLKRSGYSVTVAEDGIMALNMLDKLNVLAIVLDLNLPGMNGFQICKRLKRDQSTAHIPVVMLTSSDNATDTLTGIEAGADDYIPKDDFAVENLLATLSSLHE